MCRELHPVACHRLPKSTLNFIFPIIYDCCYLWFLSCFYRGTRGFWGKGGCHLLTIAMESTTKPTTPKKHTMLPFLVVLFLISYGLMALLVVEQDRTISNQRSLINQVIGDSVELTALKGKIDAQRRAAHPKGQPAAPQANPQENGKGSVKQRKLVPLRPPKDAADTPDARRTPVSI